MEATTPQETRRKTSRGKSIGRRFKIGTRSRNPRPTTNETPRSSRNPSQVDVTISPEELGTETDDGETQPLSFSPFVGSRNGEQQNNQSSGVCAAEESGIKTTSPTIRMNKTKMKQRNIAIAFIFEHVLGNPAEEHWKGVDGTQATLRRMLNLSQGTNLIPILRDIVTCLESGQVYLGESLDSKPVDRLRSFRIQSEEAKMAAEAIEQGMGYGATLQYVNSWLVEKGRPIWTYHRIQYLAKRLRPTETKVMQMKQGSEDSSSAWARARRNWVKQLLVSFGAAENVNLKKTRTNPETGSVEEYLPEYFDKTKVTQRSIYRTAFWDETHRVCSISDYSGSRGNTHLTFPRDKNGNLDPNGETKVTRKKKLNVKYAQEVRLLLGFALTKNDDGKVDGHVLTPFSYSGKTVISIKEWNTRIRKQINHVRHLQNPGPWKTNQRQNGRLYHDDSVTKIRGIAKQTARKLLEDHNIRTVGDLMSLCSDSLPESPRIPNLTHLVVRAKECPDMTPAPKPVDHRKAANPYLSKFGDSWKDEISKSSPLRNVVCITELVEHIFQETKKLYQVESEDSDNGPDWWFYHDALSLMACEQTRQWMSEMGYLKHWILPEHGLHTDDDGLKNYHMKPVGNSPEFMPLDCSLNKDVHESVNRHVAATCHLPETDPKRFSLSTPKRGDLAYFRVLQGAPTRERIIQDCERFIINLKAVEQAQGVVVRGLGNRQGRRRQEDCPASNWGGKRQKRPSGEYRLTWLHEDASSALKEKAKMCAAEFAAQVEAARRAETITALTEAAIREQEDETNADEEADWESDVDLRVGEDAESSDDEEDDNDDEDGGDNSAFRRFLTEAVLNAEESDSDLSGNVTDK